MPSDSQSVRIRIPRNAPHSVQVQVLRRDHWLCRWCGCPVIFAPVMRHLAELVRQEGFTGTPAYYNRNWRRRDAPLLDHMRAVIDHVEAHSGGGASVISNLATACNKCNARKAVLQPKHSASAIQSSRSRASTAVRRNGTVCPASF